MYCKDIKTVLLDEAEIKEICARLGKQITEDYDGLEPVLIGCLKGCNPFIADLSRHVDLMIEFDYIDVSSYQGTESVGTVTVVRDIKQNIEGKDVIIVEDIVDTGRTLQQVVALFKNRNAKSVEIVTLLDKPEARVVDVKPKYVGKTIPKEFVIGYGLDYNEKYRNLPYVGILKEEVYK